MNQHLRFAATLVAVLALGAIAGFAASLIAGYGIPVAGPWELRLPLV